MLASNLLRQRVALRLLDVPLRNVAACAASHGLCSPTQRPRCPALKNRPSHARQETTAATPFGKKSSQYVYPDVLGVYRLSIWTTLYHGFSRVFTVAMIPLGEFLVAPAVYFSPDQSNWLLPAIFVGSAIPFIALTLASGPKAHRIDVQLPHDARLSRANLIKFADNVPLDTKVQILSMKFWPWPTKKHVKFGLLRKRQPSWKEGFSNLEYVPEFLREREFHETKWTSFTQRIWNRWSVNRGAKDRSMAPGVWDKMWKQIPEAGSERDPMFTRVSRSRGPVAMANRPQKKTPAMKVVPRSRPKPTKRPHDQGP